MDLETELRKALEPVLHWYQSDEEPIRELMDIVKDVVADLQADRAVALKTRKLSECVEWLNSSAFSAYRHRDADTGELPGYVTLVDEDRAAWVGILMPTIQECVGEVRRMWNIRDSK